MTETLEASVCDTQCFSEDEGGGKTGYKGKLGT